MSENFSAMLDNFLQVESPYQLRRVVLFSSFDSTNLDHSVQSRTVKSQISFSNDQNMSEYPIRYKYSDGFTSILAVMGASVLCEKGLRAPNSKYEGSRASMAFHLKDDSGKQLERMFDSVQALAEGFLIRDCDSKMSATSTVPPASSYWYPRDPLTGLRAADCKFVTKYANCVVDMLTGVVKTAFMRPTGDGFTVAPVRYRDIVDRPVRCIPTFVFKRLFVTTQRTSTVQVFLDSVLILDLPAVVYAPVHMAAIAAAAVQMKTAAAQPAADVDIVDTVDDVDTSSSSSVSSGTLTQIDMALKLMSPSER